MTVTVESPFAVTTLAPGQELTFGRSPGPGCVTEDDLTVSEFHGTIRHNGDLWSLKSTATYLGVEACDVESSASVMLPVGCGPIAIPFGRAYLAIHGREGQHILMVTGPVVETERPLPTSGSTEPVLNRDRCFDRRGQPLRWFQVLVALCEPTLRNPTGYFSELPSDRQLLNRLQIGSSTLERALSRAREELGLAPRTPQLRVVMSTTAIRQALVTRRDLGAISAPVELSPVNEAFGDRQPSDMGGQTRS